MPLLIADSGSTKTHWTWLAPQAQPLSYYTEGLNPYWQSSEEIYSTLVGQLLPQLPQEPQQIHFYGAGCHGKEALGRMHEGLRRAFKDASLWIESDMVAAARALCGRKPGIACILGTGANTCLWDGEKEAAQLPNLGFWLGDEGSGGWLGKRLLQDYLHQEMPMELHRLFGQLYPVERDEVLENLYRKPFPNRYAAQFSRFLTQHATGDYGEGLVREGFGQFIRLYVAKYGSSGPVHATGSVAWHFRTAWQLSLAEAGLEIGSILPEPMEGLVNWHKSV